ncbi:hypothetical protein AAVH_24178 [Aphelenchoides avenae]|nr:hypothetical protein AAVH_24178 [Aphelenchus avenae]
MRFDDDFRRRIIAEIRLRARVTGIAHRLTSADIAVEIRRMWHQWAVSFYKYKTRRTTRRPKFFYDLHFLNGLTMDYLWVVANRF